MQRWKLRLQLCLCQLRLLAAMFEVSKGSFDAFLGFSHCETELHEFADSSILTATSSALGSANCALLSPCRHEPRSTSASKICSFSHRAERLPEANRSLHR